MLRGVYNLWTSSINQITKMATVETPKTQTESDKMLDLAFAMDTTSSMSSYIRQAQQSVRQIVEEIVSKESADIKLALVEYRDHPPQDNTFVTRVHDFTSSVREMKGWLDASQAHGGGDTPEAVADALHQVLKLSWRQEATKMCVFISDAPPHGLGEGHDEFPDGCPDGLDCMEITNELSRKSITVYMVGCEPSITPYKEFFHALAHMTGGQYVPLRRANLLAQVIMGGAQEELSLQEVMDDVDQDLMGQVADAAGEDIDEDELVERIHGHMVAKGAKSKQLNLNAQPLPKASAYAEKLSNLSNMKDLRTEWKAVSHSHSASSYGPSEHVSLGGHSGRGRRGGARGKSGKKSKKLSAPTLERADVNAMTWGGEAESVGDWGSPAASDAYAVSDYVPIEKEQVARMVQKASRAHGVRDQFKKK